MACLAKVVQKCFGISGYSYTKVDGTMIDSDGMFRYEVPFGRYSFVYVDQSLCSEVMMIVQVSSF